MKRHARLTAKTPLKATTPLPRRTPLRQAAGLARTSGLEVRKAAAKTKGRRPASAPRDVLDIIRARSGARCEAGIVCLGAAPATETAHRRGKGTGGVGVKNTTSNAPSALLRVCHDCHTLMDERAIIAALRLGLKVLHGVARPGEIPVCLHSHDGWVLLDDRGGVRPAPPASWGGQGEPLPVVTVRWQADEDRRFLDDGPVFEALQRFGHLGCASRWSWTGGQPMVCPCGTVLFVPEVAP